MIFSNCLPSLLCACVFMWTGAQSCGPGRLGPRHRWSRKLTPLIYREYVPNVPELSMSASGPAEHTQEKDFQELVSNYNDFIVFKDEEGTGEDRLTTQRCKERLDILAVSVSNHWPGLKLRVTEAYDKRGLHGPHSLHTSGRAVDITTSDRDPSKYGTLAILAVHAGFDWVFYESRSHVHCSVRKEVPQDSRNIGCFHPSSTVLSQNGIKQLSQLLVGDIIASGLDEAGQATYSEIITFLHIDYDLKTVFVCIETTSNNRLLLTADHLLFVHGKSKAVHATEVRPGDMVYVLPEAQHFNNSNISRVIRVSLTMLRGVIAPLTTDGTMWVDGVLVSCYAVVSSHDLAHRVFWPLRFFHSMSTAFVSGIEEWVVGRWDHELKSESMFRTRKQLENGENELEFHWYPRMLCWILYLYQDIC